MQAYDSTESESSVTDDCTDIPPRAARALTEKMTALPEAGRAKDADDLFLVVSGSGSAYLVDRRTGACECPDATHRDVTCKHQFRVAFATGEAPIPAWTDPAAIDPHLGDHTDTGPAFAATDGGDVVAADRAETTESEAGSGDEPWYTYHIEPAHVGGARYVRCTECGAECVPAKPDRLYHRDGCSESQQ